MKVFQVHIWHKWSLWQYVIVDHLCCYETLLAWEQANCAITQLYVSILGPYQAHMLFGTKCANGLHGCYGNNCNHSNEELYDDSTT